jgi:hypothetical protein
VPSVRVAVALFVAVNALLAFLAYRSYLFLLGYCEEFPDRKLGSRGLDCLEPSHWFAINAMLLGCAIVEIAVAVVLGAAFMHRRKRQPLEIPD